MIVIAEINIWFRRKKRLLQSMILDLANLSIGSQEVAQFCTDSFLNDDQIQATADFLKYMKNLRNTHLVEMLTAMSRIPATELNQKFTDARRQGRESAIINALVNPSCLIIDEVGRCVFDKENTRMFFDVIDRRYSKEGPNNMIFTSNKSPDKWGEYFDEDSSLLCSFR